MTQQEFQEKLEGILESAKRKESRIGREEIGEAFDGEKSDSGAVSADL